MVEMSPLNGQKVTLAKDVSIGGTTFNTNGKLQKTSDGSGIIGAQFIAFTGQGNDELIYVNLAAEPILIEDRSASGKLNIYQYTGIKFGIDSDDKTIPPTLAEDAFVSTHKIGDEVKIVVAAEYFEDLKTKVTEALTEIKDESNNIAVALNSKIKASEQRMVDVEDAFQEDINTQQSDYEAQITAQQDNYEEEVDLKLDSFDARQSLLTAIKNATTPTQLDVAGGNWLDGVYERSYAGESVSPALSATTYYELETGTGTLISNSSGFGLSGNYPICKVVCDATEIIEVSNYGIYRTIDEPEYFNGVMSSVVYTDGLLTSFIDGDGVTHAFTYSDDGTLLTASDGTDTSTINRDTDGNFTGVSFS